MSMLRAELRAVPGDSPSKRTAHFIRRGQSARRGREQRSPMQRDERLPGRAPDSRIDTEPGHEDELAAAVDERAVAIPRGDAGRLKLLFQAARRAADAGLELLGAAARPQIELA